MTFELYNRLLGSAFLTILVITFLCVVVLLLYVAIKEFFFK